jgi:hypothetical protein
MELRQVSRRTKKENEFYYKIN